MSRAIDPSHLVDSLTGLSAAQISQKCLIHSVFTDGDRKDFENFEKLAQMLSSKAQQDVRFLYESKLKKAQNCAELIQSMRSLTSTLSEAWVRLEAFAMVTKENK